MIAPLAAARRCSAALATRKSSAGRLAIATWMALPLLSSCSRTSDGSIIMSAPPALPGFFRLSSQAEHKTAVRHTAAPFPPAPGPPDVPSNRQSSAIRVPVLLARVEPPFVRADPDRPLQCKDETGSSGRVRIVCR